MPPEKKNIFPEIPQDFDYDCPFAQFDAWFDMAKDSEPNDPNAMALATISPDGQPEVRMVLLKAHDKDGFVFYTNTLSRKGKGIDHTPKAALCFHWKSQLRQIRIEGSVEPVSEDEADAYYNSRARGSRIGAWASRQSEPLESREVLASRVQEFEDKFEGDENPPRPLHWSGYRVIPSCIEFWRQGDYRLHERFEFKKDKDGRWNRQRLNP